MEVPYQLEVNSQIYTVVDAATTTYLAVITGAVTDEILGAFETPGFAVKFTRRDLGSKAFVNGMYAITGSVERSFPQLTIMSSTVDYVLSCPGFQDFPMSVAIPAGSSLPFPAKPAAMRRLPVRIQGRVVDLVHRLPIAGAVIRSVDDPMSPMTPHTTVLRAQLRFPHTFGAVVQEVAITIADSAALTQPAMNGDKVLQLSTRSGLSAGSLIRLARFSGTYTEYSMVDHLGPGAANTAGEVFINRPLSSSFPLSSTAVDFVSAVPTGAPGSLLAAADMGDGVLLASQLFSNTISIDNGNPVAEIVDIGALSDSNGYYAFNGIGRVAGIVLQASAGAAQQTAEWYVEYDEAINVVDFRL